MPKSGFSVFLDANVIRGMETTDVILTVAQSGIFEVRWSEQVLDEAARNRPPGLPLSAIESRIRRMNTAFPDALVHGFEQLTPNMPADPKDQPILAAARQAGVHAVVTSNLKHIWPGIEAGNNTLCVAPSDLLRAALAASPDRTIHSLRRRVGQKQRPPQSFPEFLDKIIGRPELAGFAVALQAAVPASLQGTDSRLLERPGPASAAVKALAGLAPLTGALDDERRRSARYPRALAWAAGRQRGIQAER